MDLIEDIFKAYFDARRGKRNSVNQLRFEMNLEENLVALYREVADRRYQVGRSICFMVTYPVKREVFAADFRDRIVHQLFAQLYKGLLCAEARPPGVLHEYKPSDII